MNAISGFDNAFWDIIGKALDVPIYLLLGGETKPRVPAYCTGDDIEQYVAHGFKRVKVAMPYGPPGGNELMLRKSASSSACEYVSKVISRFEV